MRKSSHWWKTDATVHPHGDFIPHEADVVIIGAGIAGVATAYWLYTQGKKSIVVLDNGPYPGYKGAGREFGMLLLNAGKPYSALVDNVGEQKAKFHLMATKKNNQLVKRFVQNNDILCDLQTNGGLRLAGCSKELETLSSDESLLIEEGFNCAHLTESQIEGVVPSNKLYGAMYVPNEGIMDPFAFINFTASRLQDTSTVRFYYSAGVQEVVKPRRRSVTREVRLANGHTITAQHIVHANGDTPNLDCLIPYREHAIATGDLPSNLREAFPIMPMLVNGGNDYFRLDGPVLLAAGSRYSDNTEGETNIRDDCSYNPKIYQGLSSIISRLFPVTSITGHSATWTMISYTTPDDLPVVGPLPNDDQQFVVSGLGSHRFSFGFLAGRMVSDLVVGKKGGLGAVSSIIAPKRF